MRVIDIAATPDGYRAAAAAVRRVPPEADSQASRVVAEIIAEVRARGDEALLELGRRFDCQKLQALEVTESERRSGCDAVPSEAAAALERAALNITSFHESQRRADRLDMLGGAIRGQSIRPLDRVGMYVPGGTAVYPSSVLMVGLPARAAGVPHLLMCTPARATGDVDPLVLLAARLAGVERVFKIGGAQAVAAMAFGTQSIPAVDKVVGPGNVYVNLAKKQLWGVVDIDLLAGPSEVCVVADEAADPRFVAADILTQAEHDPDCAAFLITPSAPLAQAAEREMARQLESLPRRRVIEQALSEHGAIVITESMDQAIDLANLCAPEHLALMVRDPFSALGSIRNAGAVLMGDYSPQTLGDYLAGPSHTLPTAGTARFSSPLDVDTFLKKSSFIYYNRAALSAVAGELETLARAEGLEAHAAAVRVRLDAGSEEP